MIPWKGIILIQWLSDSKSCISRTPDLQLSSPTTQAKYTCTDLYDVMKGSMRWKPGPLVEVSRAPPLQRREGSSFSRRYLSR